jgi:hypothetical protein
MKRITLALITACMIAGVATAAYIQQRGRVLTATTSIQNIASGDSANDYAARCSVVVTGDENVYFMKNTTTNAFSFTNAIPVPSGYVYEFAGDVKNMSYGTTTNTATFVIAFE